MGTLVLVLMTIVALFKDHPASLFDVIALTWIIMFAMPRGCQGCNCDCGKKGG